jgi:hypothetical protein
VPLPHHLVDGLGPDQLGQGRLRGGGEEVHSGRKYVSPERKQPDPVGRR